MPRQSSSKGAGPSTSKPKAGSKKPNPEAHNINAKAKKLKAELEKCIREIATQKEKNEKLVSDHAKEVEELEQSEQVKKQEKEDDFEKFEKEEDEECSKRTAHLEETREHERKIPMQKELNDLRVVSTHFANRAEALEQWRDGGARPWQCCEWCQTQWAHTGDSVPRFLDCGHTMCEGCVNKNAKYGMIKCAFDNSLTNTTKFQFTNKYQKVKLPKNYALLHI
ncbi:unnamed protein product [Caenorhabditis brenneri]